MAEVKMADFLGITEQLVNASITADEAREQLLDELPPEAEDLFNEESVAESREQFGEWLLSLLQEEPADDEIDGFHFGIFERVDNDSVAGHDFEFDEDDDDDEDDGLLLLAGGEGGGMQSLADAEIEYQLYLSGAAAVDPEDEDWPTSKDYWPEGRYADIPVLAQLGGYVERADGWEAATAVAAMLVVGFFEEETDAFRRASGREEAHIALGFDDGDLFAVATPITPA